MTAGRPAPMVPLGGCRVPRATVAEIARLVAATGLARCDLIRRALDIGLARIASEAANGNGGQQS